MFIEEFGVGMKKEGGLFIWEVGMMLLIIFFCFEFRGKIVIVFFV